MASKNPILEPSTDWRTYAAELAFDARQIQARLGRPLSADELEELEELDDIAYVDGLPQREQMIPASVLLAKYRRNVVRQR